MSEFIEHTSCEACGSSDARAVYGDGGSHCFKCKDTSKGDGSGTPTPTKSQNLDYMDTIPMDKRLRGISPDTFRRYGYAYNEGKTSHVMQYYNKEGKLIAYKQRFKDKTFSWKGEAKKAMAFGHQLWRSGGRSIVITEGELDCLAVAEAFDCKYPVVSIKDGAGSAYKAIKSDLDYYSSFDKVVIAFDTDEVGQEASDKVLKLFSPNQAFVMNYQGYKDANELLIEEGKGAVLKQYYEAKIKTPAGITLASDLTMDELLHPENEAKATYCYSQLNTMLSGLRGGELVTVTAGSGVGKSTSVREIAYDLLVNQDMKVGYMALEENSRRTALGFIGIDMNLPVHLDTVLDNIDMKKFEESKNKVLTDNLSMFSHFGSLDSERLIQSLSFMRKALDVDFIILDHLSIAISGLEIADERKAIDVLMSNLRSLCEETGVGLIMISHIKRIEEGKQITMRDLRGSASIEQLSDAIIAIERSVEEGENEATIRILKNRYSGVTGEAGKLRYDNDTGRLLEVMNTPNEDIKKGAKKDDTNTTKSPF